MGHSTVGASGWRLAGGEAQRARVLAALAALAGCCVLQPHCVGVWCGGGACGGGGGEAGHACACARGNASACGQRRPSHCQGTRAKGACITGPHSRQGRPRRAKHHRRARPRQYALTYVNDAWCWRTALPCCSSSRPACQRAGAAAARAAWAGPAGVLQRHPFRRCLSRGAAPRTGTQLRPQAASRPSLLL